MTNFRLPPLTLQPLVENAVKHGLSPENEPLYVSVHTREKDGNIEIAVEDTGPGFSEKSGDNEAHIGLENVRSRIKAAGGTLTVRPREGGGTVAMITLRKELKNEN